MTKKFLKSIWQLSKYFIFFKTSKKHRIKQKLLRLLNSSGKL